MLFIFPMWDNESQRIGKRKCTPVGYALHGIAEILGFIGGISLFCISGFMVYNGVTGNFSASFLWLLTGPFGVGILAEILFHTSWLLAARRGFKYDAENREASWLEDGKRVS